MTTCEFCNSEYDENNFTSPEQPIPDGTCFYCGSEADLNNVPPKFPSNTDSTTS